MNGALLELYRHKTWATLRLIEYCKGLDGEDLDATMPGTFGSIRDTLRHLVDADDGYFADVTGERLSEPLADGPVAMDELAERVRRLGPRWEVSGPGRRRPEPRGDIRGRRLADAAGGAHGTGHPPRRRPSHAHSFHPRCARPA
ncbi:MAG: hypothetical protein DLM67_07995 [Candidatus Nephthysia bennettiae]|uniref:Damage-inducible protein DinB n=1 Tax=Candidatus Nephthysia bennettiae TaxID=3127016 RepID=A0A934KC46_9BACT|nr:hypothetical protein [Candidatus Dormibacteraeota bacterium]MBJ7612629.1 hypothetical protein [Candidatus Dormibacteraeota bacterium]PZR97408.1 MAG: hypothetical protein DLM67_07995 [Candidatus Dormibacteraeota bacterium]